MLRKTNLNANRRNFILGAAGGAASVALAGKADTFENGLATPKEAAVATARNTVLGESALGSGTAGILNTAIGHNALRFASDPGVQGLTNSKANTAIGAEAMGAGKVAGDFNTAVGYLSLSSLTSGYCNTGTGLRTLGGLTTGMYNAAFGADALHVLTTGKENTAVGAKALLYAKEASHNTALGCSALYNNVAGDKNTSVGASALLQNVSGHGNTAIGWRAGSLKIDGSENKDTQNATCIGHDSRVSGNHQAQIGDSRVTTYVYGTVQNRADLRDMADVRDTILGLKFINSLRPVDYRWNYREDYQGGQRDGSKKRKRYHHGLIVQDVKKTMEALGVEFGGLQDHSVNGGCDVMSIGYDELIGPLIKAVQELSARVAELEAEKKAK